MSRKRRRSSNKPDKSPVSGEQGGQQAADRVEDRVEDRASDRASDQASDQAADQVEDRVEEHVSVGQWQDEQPLRRRTFPGPRDAEAKLRVAVDRGAYAEVVAHAKESLDAEICGVLVGSHCKDDAGPFVHVEAAVRGAEAEEGSVHVTYTQETWKAIYAVIEREHPKLQIVGWYHSHPGFGVEFSDMDEFIQKNFFSGPTQIGLVTDPLGGGVAICKNADQGIDYIDRFWVDGRQQTCQVPERHQPKTSTDGSGRAPQASREAIGALETRVSQLVHALDEMRQSFYRWLTLVGMLVAVVVVFFIANQVVHMIFPSTAEPPKGISFALVPVMVDGKQCLLGVRIVSWSIPPELIAVSKEEEPPSEPKDQKESRTGQPKSKTKATEETRPTAGNRAGTDEAGTEKAATKKTETQRAETDKAESTP